MWTATLISLFLSLHSICELSSQLLVTDTTPVSFYIGYSFYQHPEMAEDLISTNSVLSHTLVSVSTGRLYGHFMCENIYYWLIWICNMPLIILCIGNVSCCARLDSSTVIELAIHVFGVTDKAIFLWITVLHKTMSCFTYKSPCFQRLFYPWLSGFCSQP